jgi:acyl-CoA thioesterase
VADYAFYGWAGLELVSAEAGEVVVALDARPEQLNLAGVLHGGMIATLADSATGLAVRTMIEPGRRHVTVQLDVHYLAPGTPGRVTARAKTVRVGSQIAYAEADVRDARGQLIARATSTISITAAR